MKSVIMALVACAALNAPVFAQAPASGALLRADTLRAEPFADANAVAQVPAGEPVRIVERKGNWSLVEANGRRGWVRALNVNAQGAGLKREGVLALETGRQAQGGVTVPLAIRNVSVPGPAAKLVGEMFEGRDKARTLRLTARRGTDGVRLELNSPRAGFAYVFMAANAGDELRCVFPNAAQADNEMAAGKPLSLPAGGWQLEPDGAVRLIAVLTEAPIDLTLEGKRTDGPLFAVTVPSEQREPLSAALTGGGAYAAASATLPAKR